MQRVRDHRAAVPTAMHGARAAQGVVVSYAPAEGVNPQSHECVTRLAAAERLAALKGYGFGGEYHDAEHGGRLVYFVPHRTLVGCDAAAALGIRDEHDLFGGVVPHAFVGTKTITHSLVGRRAARPEGWSEDFPRSVEGAVLRGYAAFAAQDAVRAGARLLEHGAVRVKPAVAIGGRGQTVAASLPEIEAAVAAIDARELSLCGLVLEQNLSEVVTYSVGQVRVGDLVASYYGTQCLTTDNAGIEVYGGSNLVVVRGDFDALLNRAMPDDARLAVTQARQYDEAAHACFPGFFSSRRNYDVAKGRDEHGAPCCGVLEQSWRFGGASGAEIAALESFRESPRLAAVRACTMELYGDAVMPPPEAIVYFHGTADDVGRLTKYTTVEPYVDV